MAAATGSADAVFCRNDLIIKGFGVVGRRQPGRHPPAGGGSGLNTVNVASDISLARLAALRLVVSIPIDLYIEGPDGLGGFTRYYELPEILPRGCSSLSEVWAARRA